MWHYRTARMPAGVLVKKHGHDAHAVAEQLEACCSKGFGCQERWLRKLL